MTDIYKNESSAYPSTWGDPALQSIFTAKTVQNVITNNTSTTNSRTPTTSPNSNAKTTPTGAIAGGVVAGVLGVGLALAGVIWFGRRTTQQKDDYGVEAQEVEAKDKRHELTSDQAAMELGTVSNYHEIGVSEKSRKLAPPVELA